MVFRGGTAVRRTRAVIYSLAAAVVVYLALLAAFPGLNNGLPSWIAWFGAPGSVATFFITATAIGLACLAGLRAGDSHRSVERPLGVTLALTTVSAVLGFASYLWCHDEAHPPFVTSLLWTGGVMRGGLDDRRTAPAMGLCPAHAPIALDVAKLSASVALFVGIAGIAFALLESRLDRFRLRFDRSLTAVVGADADSDSLVAAIAHSLEKNTRLVLITTAADAERRGELRRVGARVVAIDFTRPGALQSLPIWHRVARLYLLSDDPSTNLHRLATINHRLPANRVRRPLTVRIDDPWQAEAWRISQLGGADHRWAADAIGRYEVTARRLLDRLVDGERVGRIIVCGTTPLTLALCANISRRRLEREFHSAPTDAPPPSVTIVGDDAEEYRQNQEIHLAQRGFATARDWLDAVVQRPSASSVAALVRRSHSAEPRSGEPAATAVLIADTDGDPMLGTMLAARMPEVPILACAAGAPESLDIPPIVGRLRTYRLTMDLPPGRSHDVWERAAKLIHNRYAAQVGGASPAARPWAQLDEFYRGSNRRQVRNALWMVEQIAGRTWDATAPGASAGPDSDVQAGPLDRLARLGIDPASAMAMAEAEHRDWCDYYRAAGWRYDLVRDDSRKLHDGLVGWHRIQDDPVALDRALTALASTLEALYQLGYRSRPEWLRFDRTGTVIAERKLAPWSWTTATGQTLQAQAGDWAVEGPDGHVWSVRDDIFRSSHAHIDGKRWRRVGSVKARRARGGETIETLEGPVTASPGDWVVRGPAGEQWPVESAVFDAQYLPEGMVTEVRVRP